MITTEVVLSLEEPDDNSSSEEDESAFWGVGLLGSVGRGRLLRKIAIVTDGVSSVARQGVVILVSTLLQIWQNCCLKKIRMANQYCGSNFAPLFSPDNTSCEPPDLIDHFYVHFYVHFCLQYE